MTAPTLKLLQHDQAVATRSTALDGGFHRSPRPPLALEPGFDAVDRAENDRCFRDAAARTCHFGIDGGGAGP